MSHRKTPGEGPGGVIVTATARLELNPVGSLVQFRPRKSLVSRGSQAWKQVTVGTSHDESEVVTISFPQAVNTNEGCVSTWDGFLIATFCL